LDDSGEQAGSLNYNSTRRAGEEGRPGGHITKVIWTRLKGSLMSGKGKMGESNDERSSTTSEIMKALLSSLPGDSSSISVYWMLEHVL